MGRLWVSGKSKTQTPALSWNSQLSCFWTTWAGELQSRTCLLPWRYRWHRALPGSLPPLWFRCTSSRTVSVSLQLCDGASTHNIFSISALEAQTVRINKTGELPIDSKNNIPSPISSALANLDIICICRYSNLPLIRPEETNIIFEIRQKNRLLLLNKRPNQRWVSKTHQFFVIFLILDIWAWRACPCRI